MVKYPDIEKKLNTGTHGGTLTLFIKDVSGRKLTVIGELKNKECWLATAYYEN